MIRGAPALWLLLLLTGCSGSRVERGWPGPPPRAGTARPLLVVDLDDTVAPSPQGSLYAFLPIWPTPPGPLPGAPQALWRLSRDFRLVFLTARPSLVAPGTLKWLDACGFPRAPVIFSRRVLLGSGQHAAFKTGVLQAIRAQGQDIRWGIGDKTHDLRAYLAVGAQGLLLTEGARDGDALETRHCLPGFPAEHILVGPCEVWQQAETLIRAREP